MYSFKLFLSQLGSANVECRQDGAEFRPELGRASYIFNSQITGIDETDAVLLVGCNPRLEAAVLNARLIGRQKQAGIPIGVIGEAKELRYPYRHIGTGTESLNELLDGKDAFYDILKNAKKPMIILGAGAVNGVNGSAVLTKTIEFCQKIGALRADWNGFNVLHHAASRVGGLDIGFVPPRSTMTAKSLLRSMKLMFLLGADELNLSNISGFVVYIGSHGDRGARIADVILPSAAYTEKSALYVNTEGRVQMTNRASFPPGEAREDWAIICALAKFCQVDLPFNTLYSLRESLFVEYPHLQKLNVITSSNVDELIQRVKSKNNLLKVENFMSPIQDFYLTNAIARSSATMAQCSALAQKRSLVKA